MFLNPVQWKGDEETEEYCEEELSLVHCLMQNKTHCSRKGVATQETANVQAGLEVMRTEESIFSSTLK